MIIQGLNAFTGSPVAIEADSHIQMVAAGPERKLPTIAPGFIDIQVNGYAGVDFGFPGTSVEQISLAVRSLYTTGVSRFFPTVITSSQGDTLAALRNLAAARSALPEGESIEGLHVEGPFISEEDGPRGAHPREWVRAANIDEYQRWKEAAGGLLRLITLAPECPGAIGLIERIAADGLTAAIGHTAASGAEIEDAVRAGASLSTHLSNGAHAFLPRHPNYIWDQLADDRLAASFIADGIHLPAAFLKTAFRAKGVVRCVLVTDASAPAGCTPGRYMLAGQEVELTAAGRVTLAGQERLAGSALRLDRAVENAMRMAAVSLAEAIQMVTSNPAALCRIAAREGGLAAGQRADFVVFDYDAQSQRVGVRETWVGGRRVFASRVVS